MLSCTAVAPQYQLVHQLSIDSKARVGAFLRSLLYASDGEIEKGKFAILAHSVTFVQALATRILSLAVGDVFSSYPVGNIGILYTFDYGNIKIGRY